MELNIRLNQVLEILCYLRGTEIDALGEKCEERRKNRWEANVYVQKVDGIGLRNEVKMGLFRWVSFLKQLGSGEIEGIMEKRQRVIRYT